MGKNTKRMRKRHAPTEINRRGRRVLSASDLEFHLAHYQLKAVAAKADLNAATTQWWKDLGPGDVIHETSGAKVKEAGQVLSHIMCILTRLERETKRRSKRSGKA